ncbi:MAG: hypothetical protein DRN65_06560 [Thaumarchaeota archaeon]|nr:MAG: hypothetical protein DRN65_06560 [Nitrososphaerota archaeon]
MRGKKIRVNDEAYLKIRKLALEHGLAMCQVVERAVSLMGEEEIKREELGHPEVFGVSPEYLAGLWDGEGSFYIAKTKYKYKDESRVRLMAAAAISNSNKEFMEQLLPVIREITGGCGFLYLAEDGSRPHHKKVWKIQINGQKGVLALIKFLAPHLKIKWEQANLLYKFCTKERRGKYKIGETYDEEDWEIYRCLKELNKRGR